MANYVNTQWTHDAKDPNTITVMYYVKIWKPISTRQTSQKPV